MKHYSHDSIRGEFSVILYEILNSRLENPSIFIFQTGFILKSKLGKNSLAFCFLDMVGMNQVTSCLSMPILTCPGPAHFSHRLKTTSSLGDLLNSNRRSRTKWAYPHHFLGWHYVVLLSKVSQPLSCVRCKLCLLSCSEFSTRQCRNMGLYYVALTIYSLLLILRKPMHLQQDKWLCMSQAKTPSFTESYQWLEQAL